MTQLNDELSQHWSDDANVLRDENARLQRRLKEEIELRGKATQDFQEAKKRFDELSDKLRVVEPTHNDDAERSVLGSVLLDNRSFFEIANILTNQTDFYRNSHRVVWRTMREMIETEYRNVDLSTNPIGVLTMSDFLVAKSRGTRELLDSIGGPNFIASLANFSASSANCAHYANIVRRHADLRRLVEYGRRIETMATDADRRPEEIISDVVSDLMAIAEGSRPSRRTAKVIDDDWGVSFDASISEEGGGAASTGIRLIDKMIGGGIFDSRSYYLGGLTKMGKTTLAVAMAGHLMFRHDYAIDWVSVEMSDIEIEEKFLAYRAEVDFDQYREAERLYPLEMKTKRMRQRVREARADWRLRDIQVEVKGAPNTRDIEMMARSRVAQIGGRRKYLLVVDYLQNCHNGNSRQSEYDRITEASKRLNGISKDLGVPVLILFQFDKQAEKQWLENRRMPRFSNLRGSSQAGNDANHFLILHRNWRDKPEDERNLQFTEVLQDLSRHGNLGFMAQLEANLSVNRFKSWSGDLPPAAQLQLESSNASKTTQALSGQGINKHTSGGFG